MVLETKKMSGPQGRLGRMGPGSRGREKEVFAKIESALVTHDDCCIYYEDCKLTAADIATLDPIEQRFYVNHSGSIKHRTCKLHPDIMCMHKATMQVHHDYFPNDFHLDCCVAQTPRWGDDPRSGLRDFCFMHMSADCFSVVNYARLPPPLPAPPSKPCLVKSTYAMLFEKMPRDVKVHDEDQDAPNGIGLKRLLFAVDHFNKDCGFIINDLCKPIWKMMAGGILDELLMEVLPGLVYRFEDRVQMQRMFVDLWHKFDRSANNCQIRNCLCKVLDEDSDSENE